MYTASALRITRGGATVSGSNPAGVRARRQCQQGAAAGRRRVDGGSSYAAAGRDLIRPLLVPRDVAARSGGGGGFGPRRHPDRAEQPSSPKFRRDGAVEPAVAEEALPAAKEEEEPVKGPAREFIAQRLVVFAGLLVGYASFYLTRNSFNYTAPAMVQAGVLDITQVGMLTSIFPMAYGFSKFVAGVLGELLSPSKLLAIGLLSTAAVNLAFGVSSSFVFFVGFVAANGVLQGAGAPACARMISSWFAPGERGTYWGIWNVGNNLGGFLAPLIAGFAATTFGWRYGMLVPGAIAAAVSVLLMVMVKDSPEAAGFGPVADDNKGPSTAGKPSSDDATKSKAKPSLWKSFKENVLTERSMWLLALCYFFVYTVRQGVTSWLVFYLIQAKGLEGAGMAAVRVSGLELGGLAGSLMAGRISDMLIRSAKAGDGAVGMRIRVVAGYCLGLAAALGLFTAIPGTAGALQWLAVAAIGFFIYGPQMLVGLCGAEIAGPSAVGASQGFLGWIAYLGAASAGVPLAILVKNYGWTAFFATLVGCSAAAAALLLPILNQKSYQQRLEEKAKAA